MAVIKVLIYGRSVVQYHLPSKERERVAGLIKKFVPWKSVPSRRRVTKKEECFASEFQNIHKKYCLSTLEITWKLLYAPPTSAL